MEEKSSAHGTVSGTKIYPRSPPGKSYLLFYGKQGTCKMEHQLSVLSHMIGKNRLNLMFKRTLEK